MRRRPERWVVIPGWDRFQHYKDRNPAWVKTYTELLHDPDFLGLSGHERGVLLCLWLEYASTHRRVPLDTSWLTRRFNVRVSMAQLESLNHAGFIEFSASKPLAPLYHEASLEKEKDKEPPYPHSRGGNGEIFFDPPEVLQDVAPVEQQGRRAESTNPRARGENPRAAKGKRDHHARAVAWLEHVGHEIPPESFPRVLREEYPELSAEHLHDLEERAEVLRLERLTF